MGKQPTPIYSIDENTVNVELCFGKVTMTDSLDPKIEPTLFFRYFVTEFGGGSPEFYIVDKSKPRERGATFEFVDKEEERFMRFLSDTLRRETRLTKFELPKDRLIEAARHGIRNYNNEQSMLEGLVHPFYLLMLMLISEQYEFKAYVSLQPDGEAALMKLSVDNMNSGAPGIFNLKCEFVEHFHNLAKEVDYYFGPPPKVAAA